MNTMNSVLSCLKHWTGSRESCSILHSVSDDGGRRWRGAASADCYGNGDVISAHDWSQGKLVLKQTLLTFLSKYPGRVRVQPDGPSQIWSAHDLISSAASYTRSLGLEICDFLIARERLTGSQIHLSKLSFVYSFFAFFELLIKNFILVV